MSPSTPRLSLFTALVLLVAGCRSKPPTVIATATASQMGSGQSLQHTQAKTASPLPTISSTITPSPTPNPSPDPIFGIEIQGIGELKSSDEAGASWLRINALLWSQVESEPGARNWQAIRELEEKLMLAAEQGQRVILIVRSAPSWAQSIPGFLCGPIKEDKLGAYADFIADAVARYSQPPYRVKFWELGNEPDVDPSLVPQDMVFGCWGDPEDPYYGGGYYAEMLKVVYPRIKAVDPDAQVLVGGLLLNCDPLNPPEETANPGRFLDCTSSQYLEGILENGGGDFFDGVSFHAYDYYHESYGHYGNTNWHSSWMVTGPVLSSKIDYLRQVLTRYGHPDKYLMNTELALLCGRSGKEDFCKQDDFINTKSIYVVQSYATAIAAGLRANIWYSLRGWRGSELVNRNLEPNLAYQAYKFAASQLDSTLYEGEITTFPGLKGHAFNREGKRIWLLWALDDGVHSVLLLDQPAALYDFMGNLLPADKQLSITLAPIYIEWAP